MMRRLIDNWFRQRRRIKELESLLLEMAQYNRQYGNYHLDQFYGDSPRTIVSGVELLFAMADQAEALATGKTIEPDVRECSYCDQIVPHYAGRATFHVCSLRQWK